MSTPSENVTPAVAGDRVDLDALFHHAPVLTTPHDLAAPEIMSDSELDEFLATVRADRARDVA